ncbi:hypothetical protein N7492_001214 [Penicillium capsulatum]|uniref:Mitochondrial import inner membrane translocase subunit TIM54 n=1 Tax=Penicillium capsulatum TaxID=69766 RepID=A0A9W9IR46_9EURO|nr:hypothetical protein N7492_001214 [Penicillium capsulatum]
MADSSSSGAPAGPGQPQAAPKPANPAFRMLGMPNFRFKLPSRNWMIFLAVTGSFTGALIYDRREKRLTQQKWCELVGHLGKEPLPVEQMRRKLTPILTAADLDYVVIEGRREGDVRAGAAEKIRKLRRKAGEPSSVEEDPSVESIVLATREHLGIQDEPGPKGDLVIGRHTWKEYVRGVHEGWLGPLNPPAALVELSAPGEAELTMKDTAAGDTPSDTPETPENKSETEPEKEEKKEKPSKPAGPEPAYIMPTEYSSASLPPSLPPSFDASVPVEFPHILGFLNTPVRIYRFLTQRRLAESVGRDVASLVLANSARPYRDASFSADSELSGASIDPTPSPEDSPIEPARGVYEQQTVLEHEEKEWHKSVRKEDEEKKEREWLNDVVLDPRIASRMQRATLSPEDEARSHRLADKTEYIIGEQRPPHVPFWKRMWIKYGYGEDEETLRKNPILGNIDGEDGA